LYLRGPTSKGRGEGMGKDWEEKEGKGKFPTSSILL